MARSFGTKRSQVQILSPRPVKTPYKSAVCETANCRFWRERAKWRKFWGKEGKTIVMGGHVKKFAHICRNPSAKQWPQDDISRFPEPDSLGCRQAATAACGGLTLRGAVRGATLQRRRDEPLSDDIPEFPSPLTVQRPRNDAVKVGGERRRQLACSFSSS